MASKIKMNLTIGPENVEIWCMHWKNVRKIITAFWTILKNGKKKNFKCIRDSI